MKKALFNLSATTLLIIVTSVFTYAQNTTTVAQKPKTGVVSPKASPSTATPRAKTGYKQPLPSRSQTTPPAAAVTYTSTDHSLNGQYNEMLKHSWKQQGYQVLNPTRLTALWKSVQDTLRAERTKTAPLKAKIEEQAKTIKDLKTQVTTGEQNLEESRNSVNEVSFLGIGVDKSTYSTIMWGAIITLAAALLIVLFTAGKSIREAKYRRQLYDEIAAEYQAYKVKANDKEKKLARELQTERNRVEELLDKNK